MSSGTYFLTPHIIKPRNLLHTMLKILQIHMNLKSGWIISWQETSHQGLLNIKMTSEAQKVPILQAARKWDNILLKYWYDYPVLSLY